VGVRATIETVESAMEDPTSAHCSRTSPSSCWMAMSTFRMGLVGELSPMVGCWKAILLRERGAMPHRHLDRARMVEERLEAKVVVRQEVEGPDLIQ